MYKKYEPLLFTCEVCGEKIHFKMLKSCQRCRKSLCIMCTKFIEPYETWIPLKAKQFMNRKLFDKPACPQCYDEIEKENEKKKAEEEERNEWKERSDEEMYGDYEEE